MKTAVVYIRVSSQDQVTGFSLDAQRAALDTFCDQHKVRMVGFFGRDKAESAKTDNRKEFNRMLQHCKDQPPDFILVHSYDRFSRSGWHAMKLVEELFEKSAVKVLSVIQPTALFSDMWRVEVNRELQRAWEDNYYRSMHTRKGQRRALDAGRYIWPFPPFGFTSTGEKREREIIPDENGPLVRRVYEMLDAGFSIQACREFLRKKHGIKIHKETLRNVISNPLQMGFFNHPEEGLKKAVNVTANVSEALWYRVNNRTNGQGKKKYDSSADRTQLPLARFVRCEADYFLTGYTKRKKYRNGTIGQFWYYKSNHALFNISAKKLHTAFQQHLETYRLQPELVPLLNATAKQLIQGAKEQAGTDRQAVRKQMKEVEAKMADMRRRFAFGDLTKDVFDEFYAELEATRLELEAQLHEEVSNLSEVEVQAIIEKLTQLPETWANSDLETRQGIQWALFPEGVKVTDYDSLHMESYRTHPFFAELATIQGVQKVWSKKKPGVNPAMERKTGLEPATPTLARSCSTN